MVWIAFGVSAFVGATTSVISQGIATDWQNINVLQVIWDTGVGGGLSMSPLGWGAMIEANTAYDDMVATGAKVASGYYKTAGMAAIHMNKATARCCAAFLMYISSYAKMLSSITLSIYKSSVVILGTSWRTAVM